MNKLKTEDKNSKNGINILVLGSGFSKPAGLPLYSEWGKQIIKNLNKSIESESNHNLKWKLKVISKNVDYCLHNKQKTIDDYFLDIDDSILKILLEKKIIFGNVFYKISSNFQNTPTFEYFHNLKWDKFNNVFTFNYDKLPEYYLNEFDKGSIEKISHIHGHINFDFSNSEKIKSDFVGFGDFRMNNFDSEWYLEISKQGYLIILNKYHNYIGNYEHEKIKKIVFIGFGFHPSNLNAINLKLMFFESKFLDQLKIVIVDPKFSVSNKKDAFYMQLGIFEKMNVRKRFYFIPKGIEELNEEDWNLIND